MAHSTDDVESYLNALPEDRREALSALRVTILANLPEGFREEMSYGMIGYVVPHEVYPRGYHVDPRLPLPFMSIASQKRHVAVYHMGLYAMPSLMEWFLDGHVHRTGRKPDMGKSCIRYTDLSKIPYPLIGELAGKVRAEEWIRVYGSSLRR